MQTNIIHNLPAFPGLQLLPDRCIQTCVTSTPYFGLRDYGHPDQIGLEKTPEEFIEKLVLVFREVRRVMKDDGCLWLNIGDSYVSNPMQNGRVSDSATVGNTKSGEQRNISNVEGVKPKNLIGIPWMLAFALRADGWYLRQEIIWAKPNPMPESVTDRCTKAHETIFLLTKKPHYYFDHEAIKEACVWDTAESLLERLERSKDHHKNAPTKMKNGIRPRKKGPQTFGSKKAASIEFAENDPMSRNGSEQWGKVWVPTDATRNKRSVWEIPDNDLDVFLTYCYENGIMDEYLEKSRIKKSVFNVATKPYRGAHFATFPVELITPCILAGSKPGDVVLDPFMGSGTTAEVALKHSRRYVGFEINKQYIELAEKRLYHYNNLLFQAV